MDREGADLATLAVDYAFGFLSGGDDEAVWAGALDFADWHIELDVTGVGDAISVGAEDGEEAGADVLAS